MYNFDIPVEIPGVAGTSAGELYLGASHGSELPFVFNRSPQFATDEAAGRASIARARSESRHGRHQQARSFRSHVGGLPMAA